MPELPEADVVCSQLRDVLAGATVVAARSCHERFPRPPTGKISDVRRHGKWLLMLFDGGVVAAANLGMSGRFLVGGKRPSHVRWELRLRRNGELSTLRYVDPRCMGRLRVFDGAMAVHLANRRAATVGAPALALGPDAMCRVLAAGPSIRRTAIWRQALSTTVAIKCALMDQSRVAGLGNIYAAETCWKARVDPQRSAISLTRAEVERIADAVPIMLRAAIQAGGTSLGDANSYRDVNGREGGHVAQLRVYGRAGKKCYRCGKKVKSIKMGGRTTCYCPGCQR